MQDLDLSVRHVIQTILKQIADVNNHLVAINSNPDALAEDKAVTTSHGNYHLLVLSILLHDLVEKAIADFPDAANIIDWSEKNYNHGLENNLFTPCSCKECKTITVEIS